MGNPKNNRFLYQSRSWDLADKKTLFLFSSNPANNKFFGEKNDYFLWSQLSVEKVCLCRRGHNTLLLQKT